MSETDTQDNEDLSTEDLELVDDSLEDEAKSDEDIWDEIDAEESGEAIADDDADDPAPSQDAGEDAPDDDDPAADAANDQPASDDAGDADDPGEDDPWDSAPQEARALYDDAVAKIEKLEHSVSSERGRRTKAERELDALRTAAPADSASDDDADAAADARAFLDSDEWKSTLKEYPEVAEPLTKFANTLLGRLDATDTKVDAVTTRQTSDTLNREAELLDEKHPDWEDVTAAEEFADWLSDQPRHIREAANRNAEGIVDAEEAADVVGRYKAFVSAQEAGDGTGDEAPADDDAGKTKPTRLSDKRKRQLDTAAGTHRGGPGHATGIPEDGDPEAIWKMIDEKERREAQRA